MNKTILGILLALYFSSCQSHKNSSPPASPKPTPQVTPQIVHYKASIMAYNLENLFDEIQNNGETFYPLEILHKKLNNLGRSILQVGTPNSNLKGPDILLVSEVENKRVLDMLIQTSLQNQGYNDSVLIESNDERGIDVGIISRFPVLEKPILHKMPFSDINPTRGILHVVLKLPTNIRLHVFAVHFPSQSNPTWQREQALQFLKELMTQVPKTDYAIAGGDFNISQKEEDQNKILKSLSNSFQVSHFIGCGTCKGTYKYKERWDFLDVLITSKQNSLIMPESIQTPNQAPEQINSEGSPKRFDRKTSLGVSDHFPIFALIEFKKN